MGRRYFPLGHRAIHFLHLVDVAQQPLLLRTSSGPSYERIEPLDFAAMTRFFASIVWRFYDEGPPKTPLLWILSARGVAFENYR
jgi:hypothetical protein